MIFSEIYRGIWRCRYYSKCCPTVGLKARAASSNANARTLSLSARNKDLGRVDEEIKEQKLSTLGSSRDKAE